MRYHLEFSSDLNVSRGEVWKWITSIEGINAEIKPLSMTVPPGIKTIDDMDIVLNKPVFRSRIKLFGMITCDYSDLTLADMKAGYSFIESSNMGSMKFWRHERKIIPNANGCTLKDSLTFEGKFLGGVIRAFLDRFFQHRHKVLRRNFSG